MNVLAKCEPSRWAAFLSIPDNATPTRSGEDVDLFVGKNKSITLTLPNGTETRFRDIVVLGELILQSSNPDNTVVKPELIANDFFSAAKLVVKNVSIKCRYLYLAKNREVFRSELQELFMEWMDIQKESVARIGLKSILV